MMQPELSDRVIALEETVAGLQELPKQLASMKVQFEAFFKEFGARFEQIDARFARIDERFERIDERFEQLETTLRREIREGDEQTRDFMRALHEDVIAKIATLGGNGPSGAAPVKRPRQKPPKG